MKKLIDAPMMLVTQAIYANQSTIFCVRNKILSLIST
mgnify:CR=1 FL=1